MPDTGTGGLSSGGCPAAGAAGSTVVVVIRVLSERRARGRKHAYAGKARSVDLAEEVRSPGERGIRARKHAALLAGKGAYPERAGILGVGGSVYHPVVIPPHRRTAVTSGAGSDPRAGEAFRPGSVFLVKADGRVRQVAEDVAFPNGMAVTPDNATLIVADSYRHQLVAFAIDADGVLSDRRVWAELGEGVPDGICVDAQNAVWYAAVPHPRCVRVAEGGTVLQTLDLDRGAFACTLGGPGRTTLFVVAAEWRGMTRSEMVTPGTGRVLTTEIDVPGAGWP